MEDKTAVLLTEGVYGLSKPQEGMKREKNRTVVSGRKEPMVYLTSKTAAQTARLPCTLESSWMLFPRKFFRKTFVQNFVFQYYSYLAEFVVEMPSQQYEQLKNSFLQGLDNPSVQIQLSSQVYG